MATCILLMGVAGSGKTEIGRLLADRLGFEFLDADAFHPPANVERMRQGIPLVDADRWPWLDRLAAEIGDLLAEGRGLVLACSALARRYRDRLGIGRPGVRLVHLDGDRDLIAARLAGRRGHFMNPALLESQFALLERPSEEEQPIAVDVAAPPPEIVNRIIAALDPA
jgi:gluconokinase